MKINAYQASPHGVGISEPQKREIRFLSQWLCARKVKITDWTSDQSELTCKVVINVKGQFVKQVRVSLKDHTARCLCPATKIDSVLCVHVLSVMMLQISEKVEHSDFQACVASVAKCFAASIPWQDRPMYRGKLDQLNRIARSVIEQELQMQPIPPHAPPPIASAADVPADGGDDDASSLASTLPPETPRRRSSAASAAGPCPPSPAAPLYGPASAECSAAEHEDAAASGIDFRQTKRRAIGGGGGAGAACGGESARADGC